MEMKEKGLVARAVSNPIDVREHTAHEPVSILSPQVLNHLRNGGHGGNQ